MNLYEKLQEECYQEGLVVREMEFEGDAHGLIKGKKVAINSSLTTSRKACVLAEEIGHYYTGYGNILDQSDSWNRKQELQGREHGFDRVIGLERIVNAFLHKVYDIYDMADFLEVPSDYLIECIEHYKVKYNNLKAHGDYIIMFQPFMIMDRYKDINDKPE